MMTKTTLMPGLLSTCYENVRKNLYENISPERHAETYVGDHDKAYAEPEFTGKYLDICMQYVNRDGTSSPMLSAAEKVVASILENQKPNGDLSCLINEEGLFTVWNQTFTVLGLIAYYDVTKDERALNAAIRSADHVISKFQGDKLPTILDCVNDGSEHISFILPLVRLWERTKKEEYGRFLEELFAFLETTTMNLVHFEDILKLMSRKGIEMLVIYLGVAAYGKVTGKTEYIDAAERYWKQVNDTQIRNTGNGTIVEFWHEGGNRPANLKTEDKPNETCVAVGFSELALSLFWERGEAVYLDAVEKSLFNHLMGAMNSEGTDFGYYQGNFGVKVFCTRDGLYQCCRYRGYTFFSHIHDMLYHYDGKTIIPVIYGASTFESEGLSVKQDTVYPKDGTINFTVKTDSERLLKLRIPSWCKAYLVSVNQKPQNLKKEDGFVTVVLAEGETEVSLMLVTDIVAEYGEIDGKPYAAFSRGPLLLALDSNLCPDETVFRRGCFVEEKTDENYNVRVKCGDLTLVDYASAGRAHPGVDTFRVWIPTEGTAKKIVCIGDSLTEGDFGEIRGVGCTHPENYPFFLSRLLNCETVNYGKCGYTSTDVLRWYHEGGISLDGADLVVLMLGTNQGLSLNGDTTHLESYRKLLDIVIGACGKDRVVLCTPPHATEIEEKVNYGYNHFVINACDEVIGLAKEYQLPLIDFYHHEELGEPFEDAFQPFDGLHFAALGYRKIADIVKRELLSLFPNIVNDN